MFKQAIFGFSLFFLMILTACTSAETNPAGEQASGKLQIVTTIGQITDIVQIVGGEYVQVTGLMGPGTDPHLYVASASDVDKLQSADIIFYNGLFLEAQMEEIFEQLAERKTVVPVSRDIDRGRLLDSPTYAGEYDPHIWFDVTLWMEAVKTVQAVLTEKDPAHAETYKANAEAYLKQMEELHSYVQQKAAELPAEQRVLITAHDAFNYFGRAYGFEVRGLQGISTQAEASTSDVQELADFIAENKIKSVFVESSVPIRNVEAVQAAVSSRGFEVTIGGQLFSDAMGDANTPQGTYLGMVRHNIDTIVKGLGQ